MKETNAQRFGPGIKARRAELGITLDQLALSSGVSRGTLSRIENSALTTSLANAVAIAESLGTDLSHLLNEHQATLQRAGEATEYVDAQGIRRTAIARPSAGVEMIGYLVPAGAQSVTFASHAPGAIETMYIYCGELKYWCGEVSYALRAGDSLSAPADRPHSFENSSAGDCEFTLLMTTPR